MSIDLRNEKILRSIHEKKTLFPLKRNRRETNAERSKKPLDHFHLELPEGQLVTRLTLYFESFAFDMQESKILRLQNKIKHFIIVTSFVFFFI